MWVLAQAPSGGDVVVGFVFLVIGVVILVGYFIPTVIAFARKHHNAVAIFVLNLILGWTFLGWVAALVWSVTAVQSRSGGDDGSY